MKKRLFMLCTALALLSACSSSEEFDGGGESGGEIVGGEVSFTSSLTRVTDCTWDDDDRVGIYAGSNYSNIEYYGGDALSAVDESIYLMAGDTDYIAYYPYSATLQDGVLPIDVSDQDVVEDLLYATATSSDDSVNLTFDHLLAKINLTIKAKDDATLSNTIYVRISNIATNQTCDLLSGKFVDDAEIGEINLVIPTSGAASVDVELMMLPIDNLDDLAIFIYNSSTWWETDFVTTQNINEWKSGDEYDYTLNLSDDTTDEVSHITISGSTNTLYCYTDSTVQLSAIVFPINTTSTAYAWSSDDPNVADVDATGLVTPTGVGTTKIFATSTVAGYTDIYGEYEIIVDELLTVGNYLYSDMTQSRDFNPNKSLLGVVYIVNDDGVSGKVLYPYTTSSLAWSTSDVYSTTYVGTSLDTGGSSSTTVGGVTYKESASSTVEGVNNMKVIYNVDPDFSDFPVFEWVAKLNDPDLGGDGALNLDYSKFGQYETGVWYLPSEGEYKTELLTTYFGTSQATLTASIEAIEDGVALVSGYSYITSSELAWSGGVGKYRPMKWNGSSAGNGSLTAKDVAGAAIYVRAAMNFKLTENND